MNIRVADIETNKGECFQTLRGFDTVHCIVTIDPETGKVRRYHEDESLPREGTIGDGLRELEQADLVVGHNWQNFDERVLRKVYPEYAGARKILDTLVSASVLWSDLRERDFRGLNKGRDFPKQLIGRQSLEAWGHRLGEHKDDFGKQTNWEVLDQEMLDYCVQDVRVNVVLYQRIAKRIKEQEMKSPLELEHQFARCISRVCEAGFRVDTDAVGDLIKKLQERKAEIGEQLAEAIPPFEVPYVTPKKKLQRIKIVEFNPGSRMHMAQALTRKYGWKPKEFTPEGRPKMDEALLEALPYPEAKLLAEYLMVQKRLGQIAEGRKAWLRMVGPDGRIHPRISHNGTVTHRCTHADPNLGQVPATYAPYGEECRSCFIPREGWDLVGADAKGLELRALAHYLGKYDEGAYAETVLNGDPHVERQLMCGLPDKDTSKRFGYAWLYGAGHNKLAATAGVSVKRAKQLEQMMYDGTPGLKELRAKVERDHKRKGYVKAIDGRRVPTRSEHSALNSLLQSFGAIIMKRATVNFFELMEDCPPDLWNMVAHVHDEFQVECDPRISDTVAELACEAIRMTTDQFNLRCPMDGDAQIGASWRETH